MDAYGFAEDDPFADPEAFADGFAADDSLATDDDSVTAGAGIGEPIGPALALVDDEAGIGEISVQVEAEQAPSPATAVDAGVLDELEEAIRDVERALARLDDGSYGTCEACATPLAQAEMAHDPTVRFCTAHLPLRVD